MALNRTGKAFYAITFLLALPAALVLWADATASAVTLPMIASMRVGLPIALIGVGLLLAGMRDLWVHGGGLPMNAAPPPRYVARGAYALVPHPIYCGFCALCAGISIATGSASGLWLITPIAMLGCTALVLGYEHHDLKERFGGNIRRILPPPADTRPSAFERARCFVTALCPWLAFSGAIAILNHPPTGWSMVLAALSFTLMTATAGAVQTQAGLRHFSIRGLMTLAFALSITLAIPLAYAPSFPVMWSLMTLSNDGERATRLRSVLRACALAVILAVYPVAPHHSALPIFEAFAIFYVAARALVLWESLRRASERIANSWREWRFGPVRILSHGLYVGLGGFVAIGLGGILAGPGHETAIFAAAILAVVGAALWAQFVEGSPQMLRPFGFYGGLLGGIAGALIAPVFHTSIWLLLAIFSAIGSFGQGLGRLRCLVQGCCHGKPSPEAAGIRYTHPQSRVCRFTQWSGQPLHPTPLYSLLWNAFVAIVELRLWTLHAALPLICGVFFMLNGIGRFVEESYRGEPQTRIVAGLRLYQWAAVASLILGAILTTLPGPSAPTPSFHWIALLPALAFGLFTACAMGVDLPASNRRFSRLA